MPNVFEDCQGQFPGGNGTQILQCISDTFQEHQAASEDDLRSFLMVLAGAMIFFMQAGFAVLCAGSVRIKNVQNTMLKNLLDACGAALAFFLVGKYTYSSISGDSVCLFLTSSIPFCLGHAFAFGGQDESTDTTFIGTTDFVVTGPSPAFWFFQYAFSATSVTIVAGTLAERCQMAAYLCYSVVLAGFIYPVIAHSVWSHNGFLSKSNVDPFLGSGALDFAGSGVVHMTGGCTALYATLILGPRRGRFDDERGEPLETPKPFPGHSIALQLLGTMILWFGCKFCRFSNRNVPNPSAIPFSPFLSILLLKGTDSMQVRLWPYKVTTLVPLPRTLLSLPRCQVLLAGFLPSLPTCGLERDEQENTISP
jgi:Amt family ammonium transporter